MFHNFSQKHNFTAKIHNNTVKLCLKTLSVFSENMIIDNVCLVTPEITMLHPFCCSLNVENAVFVFQVHCDVRIHTLSGCGADFKAFSFILMSFKSTKRRLSDYKKKSFFPKDWLEKCKDKCEEEFRLLLNGDERLCAVGWSAAHQVNSGQSLGEVVLHQLGEGCEDLSGAFYQHRLHACSRSQRELRKRKRKKVSVK